MSSASDEESSSVSAAAAAGAVVDFIGRGPSTFDDDPFAQPAEAGAMIDLEGFCYADYRLEQYASDVGDFSSQYGSQYSISYTATNITGRPQKYPDYGDFPETYAMRTYGAWWKEAPSHAGEIQSQNFPSVMVQDFIVLYFEDYIIPDEIAIFETFNPGAVVRIWAYTIMKTWFCLWEDEDFYTRSPYTLNKARRFSPHLKKLNLPTRTIRLEFNHSRVSYFTEIDAVLLGGRKVNIRNTKRIIDYFERQRQCSILRKLQLLQFRPNIKENYQSNLQEFLTHDLNKFISVLAIDEHDVKANDDNKSTIKVGLKDMPFEIMLNIFSYLDLASLFRVGQVSRFFYDVSTHTLLYSELNLKPYWNFASTELLCTLAKRATVLKKLDLSWCGLFNTISPTEFKKFIQQRGDTLTHLRLNCCRFLNASCIETVGIVCDNLKELSLRNCSTESPLVNFSCLANLKNLERLDLFQTVISTDLVLTMLESNRKLKYLNLAFCGIDVHMDDVALHIGRYNQRLVSLDMWKSHFLSAVGLQALSNCRDLEEVDFGWCLREASLGHSLRQLLTNCTKIRKLFLATVRGLTDSDVENIANLCSNLEQLDLMGVLGISKERYYDILVKCRKLKLLDLSFCDNIDDNEISLWARTFQVNIKCSHMPHVPLDLRYALDIN